MNNSGITVTGNKCLILMDPLEEVTSGGIALPSISLNKERQEAKYGTVVEIGPGAWPEEYFPEGPWAKLGDHIMMAKYVGISHITDSGEEYRIIQDKEILGVLNE